MSPCLCSILKFNSDGKFKIVQFTDIHFDFDQVSNDNSSEVMKTVLNSENPDFVAVTGDAISGYFYYK